MVQTERYQKELVAGSGFNPCDTYALAAAIDDTLVTESEQVRMLLLHQISSDMSIKHAHDLKLLNY